jgi:S-adenosylmethionine synthetase
MVQLAYGIGIAEPLSIHIDICSTAAKGYDDSDLKEIVRKNFKLTPGQLPKT